jgi:hypothetical protein
MPRSVSWIDRMRIERLVWALDQRLYDLPYRSRIAHRREVRQNLLAATRDVRPVARSHDPRRPALAPAAVMGQAP